MVVLFLAQRHKCSPTGIVPLCSRRKRPQPAFGMVHQRVPSFLGEPIRGWDQQACLEFLCIRHRYSVGLVKRVFVNPRAKFGKVKTSWGRLNMPFLSVTAFLMA